jgi:recombination protein RecT
MPGTIEKAANAKAAEKAAEPPKLSLATVAEEAIRENLPRFQAVLPRGWDKDRFQNLVVTAVKREPKLIRCFTTSAGRMSLLVAAMQCAAIGLEPNTPLKEAALVPRKNKQVDECQLMIEYRGLIKLARRSGELSTIDAEVVHEKDHFRYEKGLHPVLEHRPYDGDEDPGPLKYCYCVATFKDGGVQFVVVPRRVVYNEHRAKSDSWRSETSRPYSPWTVFEESMWRKTAVRVIEPFLPLTAEARIGFDSDDRRFTISDDAIVPVEATYDVSPPELPEGVDGVSGEIDQSRVVELMENLETSVAQAKAARRAGSEAEKAIECTGAADCPAAEHVDGCFGETSLPDNPEFDVHGDGNDPAGELPLEKAAKS